MPQEKNYSPITYATFIIFPLFAKQFVGNRQFWAIHFPTETQSLIYSFRQIHRSSARWCWNRFQETIKRTNVVTSVREPEFSLLMCAHDGRNAAGSHSQWRRHGGGGASGASCPPNLRSETPWDRYRSGEIFVSEKMEVGLQDLLRRFTCTDVTAVVGKTSGLRRVLRLQKRESCGNCWRNYSGRPSVKLRGPQGSFSPGIGPPKHNIFYVNLGHSQKNSGTNLLSFQFLAGGRLT